MDEADRHDHLGAVREVTLREQRADFPSVVGLTDDFPVVPTSLSPDLELALLSLGESCVLAAKQSHGHLSPVDVLAGQRCTLGSLSPGQSLIVVNGHAPRPMRLLDADLGKLDQEVFRFSGQVLCGPRCHGRLLREEDDLPIFG